MNVVLCDVAVVAGDMTRLAMGVLPLDLGLDGSLGTFHDSGRHLGVGHRVDLPRTRTGLHDRTLFRARRLAPLLVVRRGADVAHADDARTIPVCGAHVASGVGRGNVTRLRLCRRRVRRAGVTGAPGGDRGVGCDDAAGGTSTPLVLVRGVGVEFGFLREAGLGFWGVDGIGSLVVRGMTRCEKDDADHRAGDEGTTGSPDGDVCDGDAGRTIPGEGEGRTRVGEDDSTEQTGDHCRVPSLHHVYPHLHGGHDW